MVDGGSVDVADGSMSAPLVLAAGTYDDQAHPRIRVLLAGLRDHGWRVDEVVVPLRLTTDQRVDLLQRPSRLPLLAVAIGRSWVRLIPRLAVYRARHKPQAVVVGYLGQFDVLVVRLFAWGVPVILDYLVSGARTAADRGERGSLKQRLLRGLDDAALKSADIVVVDTPEQAEALPERFRPKAVVVPVGADERWFRAGRLQRHRGQRLSVAFHGSFTPLQGVPVIAQALRLLGGSVDATVVGGGQDGPEVDRILDGVAGVTRLPWPPSDELPALIAPHDVCLGIFGVGDKALRVVPNKAYQDAALGCVVVTSDTAPQRRAFGDAALYAPPGDAAALARTLRSLAEDRELVADLSDRARRRAEGSFSPAAVVEPLVAALDHVS